MEKTNKRFFIWYFVILFAVLTGLSYLFAYSGDDFTWGTYSGLYKMEHWFKDYNGRYVGNILEIVATRVRPLRAVMEGALLTAIPMLITALADRQKKLIALVSTLLMLICSREIFVQALVWAAGFFNYIPPLVAALLFAWFFKQVWYKKWNKHSVCATAIMLIVGFTFALCMENMTVFNVIVGIAAVIFVLVVRKEVWAVNLGWLIGSLSGMIVMFSNTGYADIYSGQDDYRTLGFGGFLAKFINSLRNVFQYGMYQNLWLNIIMTVLLVWFVSRKIDSLDGKKRTLCLGMSVYTVMWTLYAALYALQVTTVTNEVSFSVTDAYYWQVLGTYTPYFNAVSGLLYLVCCFALLLWLGDGKAFRFRVIALYGALGTIITPLFIVTPIGPRNFFAGYVVQLLVVCFLLSELVADRKLPSIASASLIGAILVAVLFWTSIYSYIFKAEEQRKAYIAEQVAEGKETIEIIIWPYEAYTWWPRTLEADPGYPGKRVNFRRWYGLGDKEKIEFITLSEYYESKGIVK